MAFAIETVLACALQSCIVILMFVVFLWNRPKPWAMCSLSKSVNRWISWSLITLDWNTPVRRTSNFGWTWRSQWIDSWNYLWLTRSCVLPSSFMLQIRLNWKRSSLVISSVCKSNKTWLKALCNATIRRQLSSLHTWFKVRSPHNLDPPIHMTWLSIQIFYKQLSIPILIQFSLCSWMRRLRSRRLSRSHVSFLLQIRTASGSWTRKANHGQP